MPVVVKQSSYQLLTSGMHRDEALAVLRGEAEKAAIEAAQGYAEAADAQSQLTDIADDGVLTPVEKPTIIREHSVITAEQAGIDAQATAAGVTTEKAAYDNAITTLTSYLSGLTSPVAWNNLTGNTTIVGATFRTRFADVYTAKQALLNAITGAGASSLTAGAGWNVSGKVCRSFGLISAFIDCNVVNAGTATWDVLATLPAGMRPSTRQEVLGFITDSSTFLTYTAVFRIATTGVVSVQYYDNGSSLVPSMFAIGLSDLASVQFTFVVG